MLGIETVVTGIWQIATAISPVWGEITQTLQINQEMQKIDELLNSLPDEIKNNIYNILLNEDLKGKVLPTLIQNPEFKDWPPEYLFKFWAIKVWMFNNYTNMNPNLFWFWWSLDLSTALGEKVRWWWNMKFWKVRSTFLPFWNTAIRWVNSSEFSAFVTVKLINFWKKNTGDWFYPAGANITFWTWVETLTNFTEDQNKLYFNTANATWDAFGVIYIQWEYYHPLWFNVDVFWNLRVTYQRWNPKTSIESRTKWEGKFRYWLEFWIKRKLPSTKTRKKQKSIIDLWYNVTPVLDKQWNPTKTAKLDFFKEEPSFDTRLLAYEAVNWSRTQLIENLIW